MSSELHTYIACLIFIVGLCLGSFYNVVILRFLSNESIVFPSSKCPKCNNKLLFWHNIPIISYLLLKGKCYFCKEKISIQYPIVELLTGLAFLLAFIKFGLTFKLLTILSAFSIMLIMTVTDLKEKVINAQLAIVLGIIGIVYNILQGTFTSSIFGLLLGIIVIEGISLLGYIFIKKRAMGEGDTYVAAALGACFGLNGLCLILIYTLIASMLYVLPLFLYKQYKNNSKLICLSFIFFILSVLVFKTLYQNYLTIGLVFLTGLVTCFSVLKDMKNSHSLTYMPFVPSMFIGLLIYLIQLTS